ncbi:MAG: HAD-IA family hydrolase, partial [Novosphingobium sp.]|nr:HAD-IA family hydrolase [Novosphingobium sp.]
MSDVPADPVEAVVFDVGRVIVQWDLRGLLRKVYDDEAWVQWAFANVVSEAWHAQHDAGRDLGEMVAERKRAFPEFTDAIEAYATRFADSIPGLVPGTPALIERLAGRGVPLFAITNFADRFWAEYRPTEPLFDHFGDIVVSGTEKLSKPGSAIYRLAARRFGYRPQDMLFIDDSLPNVEAAQRLGWQVHHF